MLQDCIIPLRSELKLRILLNLLKGDQKLAELKAEIGTRETTILHALKNLEELNLTTKSDGVYSLTSLGVIDSQIFGEFSSAGGRDGEAKRLLVAARRDVHTHLIYCLG